MDTLITTLDVTINFWVAHPNFLSIKLFRGLKDKDKKKDDFSSRVMWAIVLLVDMHPENTWRNKPEEEKKPVLAEDIIGDKDFKWDLYQEYIDEYVDRCTSIPKKELRNFINKIHDRQKFIDGTDFSLDSYGVDGKIVKGTVDQLDKMLVNTAKVWSVYDDLAAKFAESEEEGAARGGRTESISESGQI
jgi:hypothetical protein